ncbi:formimidoylglutamate deiminase [Tropicimonas isoalkanivorans]|uniref:Amidohydrolase family protein n=1 Tax=Tropicimonas isoalkanivorans TaxID=441112 RepID=A0A1I1MJ54_9RHOB|nr:formimidoylglutamate deiminase [Tropicimonas isoalkanivorans]SFC85411.1 Amidohydrolase family protein [Tropicimonas isoalkanivorans]
MQKIWARTALTAEGWQNDVVVEVSADGRIHSVTQGQPAEGYRVDCLLPAPVNCHSHAFQRAMAGLTERRGPDPRDSFWTWRRLMYRFLDKLDPDQVEAIAAFVQLEMLEAGYATNVEFHYLHHRPDGTPYDSLAEMAERIVAAAGTTGIGLTLLPVHYEFGGCDRRQLAPGQVRFGNSADRFARLVDESGRALSHLPPDSRLGVAPHSLRAVAPEALGEAAAMVPDGPIHMHLAEQPGEVEEIVAAYGKRPVEYVLDSGLPDARWCMIHSTQMTPEETEGLAASGATVGLCPITESSLGDGIFDGVRYLQNGGKIAVGSDSNIRISLVEELRTLEYSQRLRDGSRAALATPDRSTGRTLFDAVCAGGAASAGRATGQIASGTWADLLALDLAAPDLEGLSGDTLLDSFIFAGGQDAVADVWAAGRHVVRGGRHIDRDAIVARYRTAVRGLRQDL